MLDRFAVLDTATKYPEMQTYHEMGERGRLTEKVTYFAGPVIRTEKIHGTNTRIIVDSDGDWAIGARDHLLTAKGDRVAPKENSVVAALGEIAQENAVAPPEGIIRVYYLEVYGARIGPNHKQYTAGGNIGFRLFDVAHLVPEVLDLTVERAHHWREHGGLAFFSETDLTEAAQEARVDLAPRLGAVDAASLPVSIEGTYQWLQEALPETNVALDEGGKGIPEGIVLRSADRSVIAKARFQDYERTLGIK